METRIRAREKIVLFFWLMAASATALASPSLVFAISFSLSVLSTGIYLTERRR